MDYRFLLVGDGESSWREVLERAVAPWGDLDMVCEADAGKAISDRDYDLVVIDAGSTRDPATLTAVLRAGQPGVSIMVATASPTWQRARQAFRAGAVEYVRKTPNEKELRSEIQAVLCHSGSL